MPDWKPLVRLIICFVLGAIFVYAGVVKALDPMRFANDIENYRLLSWPLGMRVALYLPWLEFFCGLALILGWMRPGAIAILTMATLIFIGLSIATRLRGIDLHCGCFGSVGKGMGFATHLAIDFVILLALVLLWFLPARTAVVDK